MELRSTSSTPVYRYTVAISKELQTQRDVKKKDRKRFIQLLLQENFTEYRADIVTDFQVNLITTKLLNVSPQGYVVTYRPEGHDDPLQNAGRHRIHLSFVASYTVSELIDYLTSTNAGAMMSSREDIILALNLIVGHNLKAASQITSVTSSKHYDQAAPASERTSLGAGLTAIRGFFLSVRAATSRLLVNVQPKHTPFYEEGPLEGLMRVFMQANGDSKGKLEKFLKYLSVDVTHIVHKNKAGLRVPRLKVITSLAAKTDGAKQPHRPIIRFHGAGPKDVQFWLESFEQQPSHARYITVFDFFKQRLSAFRFLQNKELTPD